MLLVRVYLGKGPCQVTKILKSNEKRICKSKQTVVQTLDSREKTLLERAKNTKTKTNSNTMTLGKWVKNPQQKYDRRDHSPPLKRSKMRFIGLLQQLSMAWNNLSSWFLFLFSRFLIKRCERRVAKWWGHGQSNLHIYAAAVWQIKSKGQVDIILSNLILSSTSTSRNPSSCWKSCSGPPPRRALDSDGLNFHQALAFRFVVLSVLTCRLLVLLEGEYVQKRRKDLQSAFLRNIQPSLLQIIFASRWLILHTLALSPNPFITLPLLWTPESRIPPFIKSNLSDILLGPKSSPTSKSFS